MTIFLSEAVGQERLPFGLNDGSESNARTHWKLLAEAYRRSFIAAGHTVTPVLRPEIYQSEIARRTLAIGPDDWHLCVKPVTHFRPFHGLTNVLVYDEPDPAFLDAVDPGSRTGALQDPFHLLRQADLVLCPTSHATRRLRAAGIERTATLPPMLSAPTVPVLDFGEAANGSERPVIFATASDREGMVRNLAPVIEGFVQARRHRSEIHLVVNVISGRTRSQADLRNEATQRIGFDCLDSAITFLSADPSGEARGDWLAGCDYFLWTGPSGGLPIPLCEAMLAAIPAMTITTGDLTEVLGETSTLAITIDGEAAVSSETSSKDAYSGVPGSFPTAHSIRKAILAAASTSPDDRRMMGETSRSVLAERYGLDAFRTASKDVARLIGENNPA
ncbi:glycosyltransferase family 1 protein [Fulvimarina endophytica]|uniref:Glycosyltransferase family 1 protein n=1 Tax=Fulvimarina endophytica TaxID=2293836 RepID=A0A371X330_9HYPH|nr:glycosyltransferase family 1 protein [Fulvimarina endophytica]RFC63638.1 glycosyltransferase family 1 protein [Fulvimarina endophytica]